jgi:hypothetical protein
MLMHRNVYRYALRFESRGSAPCAGRDRWPRLLPTAIEAWDLRRPAFMQMSGALAAALISNTHNWMMPWRTPMATA